MRGVVVQRANDDASDAGQRQLWVGAPRVSEIFHLARVALCEPRFCLGQLWKFHRRCDSAQVKAELLGALRNPGRVRGGLHRFDFDSGDVLLRVPTWRAPMLRVAKAAGNAGSGRMRDQRKLASATFSSE